MILDWLAREGGYILSWWALATLMGAAALPLCWRLLGGLPDRGYTLARAAGVLLTGYVFWLLGSFGFVRNTLGSIVLAWLIVLIVALVAHFTRREAFDLRAWWRDNRAVIITGELLFIGLLVAWAVVRAHLPDTNTTEKPMDLMFMSAIMRSESFPPNDAWMAGYAISYYYFGYFMAAMFGKLSGVASTIAYSLHIAMLFALAALGAFGVVTNLVRGRTSGKGERPAGAAVLLTGLLAAVFVVLLGNFQAPLIEAPYQARTASEAYLAFWDTQERDVYPERMTARGGGIADDQPVTLNPGQNMLDPAFQSYWWWFRASRIIQDRDLNGEAIDVQPIDEFPQFSFVLADSHPHVMALPYVLLAIGLALNVLLRGRAPNRGEIIFYGLAIGGLIFLNTWDGPIYLLALVGAEVVRRLIARRTSGAILDTIDWLSMAGFGIAVLVLAVIFYLPFLIGFRSQAAGLLPNAAYPTLLRQYFIMFGPFVLILVPYLAVEAWRGRARMNWQLAGRVVVVILAAILVLALLLVFFLVIASNRGDASATIWLRQIPEIIVKRITHGLTSAVFLAGIAVIVARLFAHRGAADGAGYSPATGFALLLIGIGVSLTLMPEWVYLRDGFGVRANTVFKFYYQAWVVFGLASAYAVYSLLAAAEARATAPVVRAVSGALAALALALGLVYPALAIYNRMFQESGRLTTTNPAPLTLDGGPTFIRGDFSGNDYAAIMCFNQLIPGDGAVVIEAVGGTYDPNVGRVGALTGIPVLFNWPGHEVQWRGSTFGAVVGSRQQDIETIYEVEDWTLIQPLIDRYGIDYIFFGSTERNQFGAGAEYKFLDRLPVVCESGESRFYATGGTALGAVVE